MTIGAVIMTKNDETYSFDVLPIIEDGRTRSDSCNKRYAPGLDVEWNEKNNTVTITTPQDDETSLGKTTQERLILTMLRLSDGISVSDNIITISKRR